jgi:hypothetical protein
LIRRDLVFRSRASNQIATKSSLPLFGGTIELSGFGF